MGAASGSLSNHVAVVVCGFSQAILSSWHQIKLPLPGAFTAIPLIPGGTIAEAYQNAMFDANASRRDACLALRLMDSADYLLGAKVKRGHKLKNASRPAWRETGCDASCV
jgi:hypothetical protein